MPLRKERPSKPAVDERLVEQLIEKGGSVAVQEKKRPKASNFPLRFVHEDTAERIEAARKRRPVPVSMNTYINEAILDKLKAEE